MFEIDTTDVAPDAVIAAVAPAPERFPAEITPAFLTGARLTVAWPTRPIVVTFPAGESDRFVTATDDVAPLADMTALDPTPERSPDVIRPTLRTGAILRVTWPTTPIAVTEFAPDGIEPKKGTEGSVETFETETDDTAPLALTAAVAPLPEMSPLPRRIAPKFVTGLKFRVA